MNPTTAAVRAGLARGWTLFRTTVTTPGGVLNALINNGIPLAYLILSRNADFPGTDQPLVQLALPGLIGVWVIFGAISGPGYYLAAEREDGTLLRAKAVPNGMRGYVTGLVTLSALEAFLAVAMIVIPSLIIFDLDVTAAGLLALVGWVVLGLVAAVPLGLAVGSLAKGPRAVSGWGILSITGVTAISGIFFPIQALWGWVQTIAQVLPIYWMGHGMRSALLPDAAAAEELTGSWRRLEAVGVLSAWAIMGLVVAPILLARMARRESGSMVEERRQKALQRF